MTIGRKLVCFKGLGVAISQYPMAIRHHAQCQYFIRALESLRALVSLPSLSEEVCLLDETKDAEALTVQIEGVFSEELVTRLQDLFRMCFLSAEIKDLEIVVPS